jgi:hypothetical protein
LRGAKQRQARVQYLDLLSVVFDQFGLEWGSAGHEGGRNAPIFLRNKRIDLALPVNDKS